MKRSLLLCILFLILTQGTAWSQIPKTMSYQGVLKDATGALVADGNYSITFNLYDVATGGIALWTETQSSVSVASGVFSVILGSAATLNLDFTKQYWLGVTVGTDTELSPRIKLTASPYSLNALSVLGSSNTFPSDGNVGIGTTSPDGKLEIVQGGSDVVGVRITRAQADGNPFLQFSDGVTYSNNIQMVAGTANLAIAPTQGNVGIGTTSPTSRLEIGGGGVIHALSGAVSSPSSGTGLELYYDGTAGRGIALSYDRTGAAFKQISLEGSIATIYTGGSERVRIDGSGNVGIGTTSPLGKLNISNNGTFTVFTRPDAGADLKNWYVEHLGGTDNAFAISAGNDLMTDGRQALRINRSGYIPSATEIVNGDFLVISGNVGIGTTSPGSKLTVNGKIGVSRMSTPSADLGFIDYANSSNGFSFGTGSSDDPITFFTNGTEKVRIANSGNVGIGTTSPTQKLHVYGSGNTYQQIDSNVGAAALFISGDDQAYIRLQADVNNVNVDKDPMLKMFVEGATTPQWVAGIDNSDNNKFKISYNTEAVGTNDRIIVDTNGNVGIGTTSPGTKLQVSGDGNTNFGNNAITIENTGTSGRKFAISSRGETSPQRLSISDETAGAERMVIDLNGNVGIGTTSPSTILTVVQNSSTDPVADAWDVYSSRRWKTNIEPLKGALEKVQALRGVSFDWKIDGKHDIGLIAEEVGEVVPEVVAYEKNGKDAKSVDYARLVAVLIEAVKEQQNEIDELTERVAIFEAKTKLTSK